MRRSSADIKEVIQLYSRTVELIKSLNRKQQWSPMGILNKDSEATGDYNRLHNDVEKFVNDPKFDYVVPRFRRSLPTLHHIKPRDFVILAVPLILVVTLIALGQVALKDVIMGLFGLLFIGPLVAAAIYYLFDVGTIAQVYDKTKRLERYLVDYIGFEYPEVASQIWPPKQVKAEKTSSQDQANLRQNLVTYLSDGELRDVCFDLNVDYESLTGEGKADKARELVAYCERTGRIPELVAKCRELRPNVSWEDVPA